MMTNEAAAVVAASVRITVPSCWKCGRWVMTPEAQAAIEGAGNEQGAKV